MESTARKRATAGVGKVVDQGRQSGEQRQWGGAGRKSGCRSPRKQKEFDDVMRLLKERVAQAGIRERLVFRSAMRQVLPNGTRVILSALLPPVMVGKTHPPGVT